jgi:hypothetical protein
VQLSDSLGIFSSPIDIGMLVSVASAGTIAATIPAETLGGSRYRLRVVSSHAGFVGSSYGQYIRISTSPVNVAINGVPGLDLCLGYVSFSATTTSEGLKPDYEWKRNGTVVGTGRGYTDHTLQTNDVITCTITSKSGCASPSSVTSNGITITRVDGPKPTVVIEADLDEVCFGTLVTFTATASDFHEPLHYNWEKNNISVGNDSNVYQDNALEHGDRIRCVVDNSYATECISSSIKSNIYTITVWPLPPKPQVTVTEMLPESAVLTSSAGGGNQWYFNNVLMEGETEQVLSVTTFGDYKVQVTMMDCTSEFSDTVPFLVLGDVESFEDGISVYPSPVDKKLIVILADQKNSEISIFRIDGTCLLSAMLATPQTEIDVSAYSSGIYFVRISNEHDTSTLKFLKE